MAKVRGGQGMNTLYLVLGVIVFIILAYFIYSYWFSGVNTLASGQINLNTTKPPSQSPILATSLTKPSSTLYTYGLWVYVNSWDTTKPKVIFSRYNDIVLYLDKTSAVLNCIISPTYSTKPSADALIDMLTTATTPTNPQTINITNNFPIQTWVYVTVVISNQKVDFYLNGKMVKTLTINQVATDATSNIYLGYNFDAMINQFQRWSVALDPQTVYNNYISSSSAVSSSSLTGGYHATVQITQNNAQISEIKIF